MHDYTRDELRRAERSAVARYAAKITGLPVAEWKRYDGPIDVDAFVATRSVPVDPRDHARAFADLRAAFWQRYAGGLFREADAA